MSEIKRIQLPLTEEDIKSLHAGDEVLISGDIYTARDAAHKRLVTLIHEGKPLPINLNNATIYYTGSTPPQPGAIIGSCGPTTSYRMDAYTEDLLKCGLKVMIGKGARSEAYCQSLVDYQAIYISAIGGTAALIAKSVKECHLVCYEDLGSEAIYHLKVEDFYGIVTYDIYHNSILK